MLLLLIMMLHHAAFIPAQSRPYHQLARATRRQHLELEARGIHRTAVTVRRRCRPLKSRGVAGRATVVMVTVSSHAARYYVCIPWLGTLAFVAQSVVCAGHTRSTAGFDIAC